MNITLKVQCSNEVFVSGQRMWQRITCQLPCGRVYMQRQSIETKCWDFIPLLCIIFIPQVYQIPCTFPSHHFWQLQQSRSRNCHHFGVIIIIIIQGIDSTEQATHNSFGLRQCDIYFTFLESCRSGYGRGVSDGFAVMTQL